MVDLVAETALSAHPWLAGLGVEPLGPGFDGRLLRARLGASRTALKVALMDQRRIAGIGNIYASEALFRARLSPEREAGALSGREAGRLARAIRAVLADAIAAGGSSLRDYVQSNGELGMFQHAFRVYDRAGLPCTRCGTPLARLVQGGRATYLCPRCQPRPDSIGAGRAPGSAW
jgi:formamidopyrimidine-DNA glycosylase